MWRYYQTGEKKVWQALQDNPNVLEEAKGKGAKRITILATSNNLNGAGVESEAEMQALKDTTTYKGPLYFDIDDKGNLKKALESTRELVFKLAQMDADKRHIRIYCSGSKGFHVIVDSRTFSTGRAVKDLPLIYKEMARDLHVPGMDFQVYSRGKGVCWRIPNVQREDKRFRVELTHKELEALDIEKYAELCSSEKDAVEHSSCLPQKAVRLSTLFERAKAAVVNRPRNVTPLTDEQIEPIRDEAPKCITALADAQAMPSVNLNEASLQLGIYCAKAGVSDTLRESLQDRMASEWGSSQYPSERARKDHVAGVYKYTAASAQYGFSCKPLIKMLTEYPCEGCALRVGTQSTQLSNPQWSVVDNSYFAGAADRQRQLSNFIIDIDEIIYQTDPVSGGETRTGMNLSLHTSTRSCRHFITEAAFSSRSNFIRELQGKLDCTWTGTDSDVQELKGVLLNKEDEMGKITQVYTAGLILESVGIAKSQVAVYVEEEGSVNHFMVGDTHRLSKRVGSLPSLLTTPDTAMDSETVDAALMHLLESNHDLTVSYLAGWYAACHLKQHIMQFHHQFPILSLWGAAGSGKTMSAMLWAALSGIRYHSSGSIAAMSVGGMSRFALLDMCSTTTTIPRLLDEFNPSKLKGDYAYSSEILKAAWNGSNMPRGTLDKTSNMKGRLGASTIELPISSPLVFMSEQSLPEPAQQQRSVSVYLTRRHREGRAMAFHMAERASDNLLEIAKALVMQALITPPTEVRDELEGLFHLMDPRMDDRRRFSEAVVLVGLSSLTKACSEHNLVRSKERLSSLRQDILNQAKSADERLHMHAQVSEIDLVMKSVMSMVDLTESKVERSIVEGVHYSVMGDQLLLSPSFHPAYLRFVTRGREVPSIDRYDQFETLIDQEPYFVAKGLSDATLKGSCIELSIPKMKKKGIDTSVIEM